MSRRSVLRHGLFITAGATVGSQLLTAPGYAAGTNPDPDIFRKAFQKAQRRHKHIMTGIPSKNGWEMEKVANNRGNIYTRPVPGTPLDGVAVRMGDIEIVLVHLIRRFRYEIDELHEGDVIGWQAPGKVRQGLAESNLASGTAVRIRPLHYPAGTRGGFFPLQTTVIRDVLAELEGVVRWSGDDRKPDEALFSIDVKPGDPRLPKVANKIRAWSVEADSGAGAPVDVASRPRRTAAKAMERSQRAA